LNRRRVPRSLVGSGSPCPVSAAPLCGPRHARPARATPRRATMRDCRRADVDATVGSRRADRGCDSAAFIVSTRDRFAVRTSALSEEPANADPINGLGDRHAQLGPPRRRITPAAPGRARHQAACGARRHVPSAVTSRGPPDGGHRRRSRGRGDRARGRRSHRRANCQNSRSAKMIVRGNAGPRTTQLFLGRRSTHQPAVARSTKPIVRRRAR
jgi:hypothetical protein